MQPSARICLTYAFNLIRKNLIKAMTHGKLKNQQKAPVWVHRRHFWRLSVPTAEIPSTVWISGGSEKEKSSQKCVWPQIWPLTRPQFNNYRGVAQLIARRIWDAEAASLSLATPTKNPLKRLGFRGFLMPLSLFFVYCIPNFEHSICCGIDSIYFLGYNISKQI